METTQKKKKKRRRAHPVRAAIGAFIGAMIGAVVWAIVGAFGYIASIVGVLIAFLAAKGYDLCGGRNGAGKILVLILLIVLAVFAGNCGTVAWQIHTEYNTTFKDTLAEYSLTPDSVMTECEFFEEMIDELSDDDDFIESFTKDLGVGLLFAGLGAYGIIKASSKKHAQKTANKKKPAAPENLSE